MKPKQLPVGQSVNFQPSSQEGVSFADDNLTPTIVVPFDKAVAIHSIRIPIERTPNANVEEFKVALYSVDGDIINKEPMWSTLVSREDNAKAAEVVLTKSQWRVPVSVLEITIIRTSDDRSPRGVVLDVKACVNDLAGRVFQCCYF